MLEQEGKATYRLNPASIESCAAEAVPTTEFPITAPGSDALTRWVATRSASPAPTATGPSDVVWHPQARRSAFVTPEASRKSASLSESAPPLAARTRRSVRTETTAMSSVVYLRTRERVDPPMMEVNQRARGAGASSSAITHVPISNPRSTTLLHIAPPAKAQCPSSSARAFRTRRI